MQKPTHDPSSDEDLAAKRATFLNVVYALFAGAVFLVFYVEFTYGHTSSQACMAAAVIFPFFGMLMLVERNYFPSKKA
jgi:hypothetical protein